MGLRQCGEGVGWCCSGFQLHTHSRGRARTHTRTHTPAPAQAHRTHSIPPHRIRPCGWNKSHTYMRTVWRARVLQIRAKDESGVSALTDALGSGDSLKNKLNQALNAQGLEPSTGVSPPQVVCVTHKGEGRGGRHTDMRHTDTDTPIRHRTETHDKVKHQAAWAWGCAWTCRRAQCVRALIQCTYMHVRQYAHLYSRSYIRTCAYTHSAYEGTHAKMYLM